MKTATEAIFLSYEIRKAYTSKAGISIPEKYDLTFLGAADRKIYAFIVSQKPDWLGEVKEGLFIEGLLEMDVEANKFKSDNYGDAYTMVYAAFKDRTLAELTPA